MKLTLDELRHDSSTRPDHYVGSWPGTEGFLLTVAMHRDSDAVDRSNFEIAQTLLVEVADTLPPDDEPSMGWVTIHRASHWAVGWVEYLWVADTPKLAEAALNMLNALTDYPVLDEMHLSELESTELADHLSDNLSYLTRSALTSAGHELDELPDTDRYLSLLYDLGWVSRADDLYSVNDEAWLEMTWLAAEG